MLSGERRMNNTSGSSMSTPMPERNAAVRQPERQDRERDEGKDHHAADGLSGLHDRHGEPALVAEPVIDRGHRGVVEADLKAHGQGPDEDEDENEIASP